MAYSSRRQALLSVTSRTFIHRMHLYMLLGPFLAESRDQHLPALPLVVITVTVAMQCLSKD